MSSPDVIIDVANMARAKDGCWWFARILDIREQWLREHPGAYPYGVVDAGVVPLFGDQELLRRAQGENWLEVHAGDADDVILRLAQRHQAAVISKDRFNFARREHPWLQGNATRVWDVRRNRGRVTFTLRPLKVATDAEIDEDRRKKRRKAGLLAEDSDRRWRCTSDLAGCRRGGAELTWNQVHDDKAGRLYCRTCEHEAVEVVARPQMPEFGPLEVTVLHGAVPRLVLAVPEQGLLLGRPSRSASEPVTDVTAGLPPTEVEQISRTHLRLVVDDDGELTVAHLRDNNATFINPQLDLGGLPSNNRMATEVPYPLEAGDELFLGPGTVRLRIHRGRPVAADEEW
ncbi:FHA domain-containing protein [Streptomyces sp. NPDC055056]